MSSAGQDESQVVARAKAVKGQPTSSFHELREGPAYTDKPDEKVLHTPQADKPPWTKVSNIQLYI